MSYINHGFWDVPEPVNEREKKNFNYPPNRGRYNSPEQRRENIEWALENGGVKFDKDYNPTYVIFQDGVYNVYNNDFYKPSYYQNKWNIQLYRMQRGVRKTNKEEQLTSFDWNHILNLYKPTKKFPKP